VIRDKELRVCEEKDVRNVVDLRYCMV